MNDILHVAQSAVEAAALCADLSDYFWNRHAVQFIHGEAGQMFGVSMVSYQTQLMRRKIKEEAILFVAGWLAGASFGRRTT
jgi:hypothetical protein